VRRSLRLRIVRGFLERTIERLEDGRRPAQRGPRATGHNTVHRGPGRPWEHQAGHHSRARCRGTIGRDQNWENRFCRQCRTLLRALSTEPSAPGMWRDTATAHHRARRIQPAPPAWPGGNDSRRTHAAGVVLAGAGSTPSARPRPGEAACPLAADQHRGLGVRQHLGRLAAEHHRGKAPPSVRRHEDEIAPLRVGRLDDRLVRTVFDDVDDIARHAAHRSGMSTPSDCAACASQCFAYCAGVSVTTADPRRTYETAARR
jgi:hypothetical protein